MQFVFRVDASIKIGTGHVVRCLTLASALAEQGHECVFICRDHPGHFGEEVERKGFKLHLLPPPEGMAVERRVADETGNPYNHWLGVTWEYDASQTQKILATLNADWLVVDHYALDVFWEQKVANWVRRIMVIDDLADRQHECSLLLDQNLGRKTSDYDGLVSQDCIRLIGPRYALLRPEFPQLRERSLKRRKQQLKLKRILIFLGGVDRTNVTGEVLSVLGGTAIPKDAQIDIIMGTAAPHLDGVRKQAFQLPFKTAVNVNVLNMAERMFQADLSIGSAGSASWERCCLGLPAIQVVLADNQKMVNQSLTEKGVALTLDVDNLKEEGGSLLDRLLVQAWREAPKMTEKAAAVTDGFGCARLVDHLLGG